MLCWLPLVSFVRHACRTTLSPIDSILSYPCVWRVFGIECMWNTILIRRRFIYLDMALVCLCTSVFGLMTFTVCMLEAGAPLHLTFEAMPDEVRFKKLAVGKLRDLDVINGINNGDC